MVIIITYNHTNIIKYTVYICKSMINIVYIYNCIFGILLISFSIWVFYVFYTCKLVDHTLLEVGGAG